jgi:hypothetical protein
MRQLLTNISAISNAIANIGNLLIVRAEATRARRAGILSTLHYGASHLLGEMRDALRQWPSTTWVTKTRVPAAACFVVKQGQRQHVDTCRRPVA